MYNRAMPHPFPTRLVRSAALTSLAATAVLLAGCNSQKSYQSPQNLPTVPVKIGSVNYTLEIVRNEENRMRGLMHRPSMPAEWGMIFVFPSGDERWGFWMKNTKIPLDIIYLDANGAVV